jgi:hypothetical protein
LAKERNAKKLNCPTSQKPAEIKQSQKPTEPEPTKPQSKTEKPAEEIVSDRDKKNGKKSLSWKVLGFAVTTVIVVLGFLGYFIIQNPGKLVDGSKVKIKITYRIPLLGVEKSDSALFESAEDNSANPIWIKKTTWNLRHERASQCFCLCRDKRNLLNYICRRDNSESNHLPTGRMRQFQTSLCLGDNSA